jgi:hypothetical protein
MPFTYLIIPEQRLLIKRAVDRLTDAELISGVRCMAEVAHSGRVALEICELDPNCLFSITPHGMHRALAAAQAISLDLGGIPQVTVAYNDLALGLARMFSQMMSKLNLRAEVCRSLPEAFAFVGVPPLDLAGLRFSPMESLAAQQ